MKTSTMFILSAIAVVFISLTAFNFDLKKSFTEGNYKNRFYGFEFIPIKNINQIDVQSANKIYLNIEQGDQEGIWVAKGDRDKIAWKQIGQILQIDLSKEAAETRSSVYLNNLTIIVNKPNKVNTHAEFSEKDDIKWNAGGITIKGLKQDQFELQADNFTSITLAASQLQQLNAIVGLKESGSAQLELAKDNVIQSANLRVEGESYLKLNNPIIVKTNYQLSEMATVTLSGKALQPFIK